LLCCSIFSKIEYANYFYFKDAVTFQSRSGSEIEKDFINEWCKEIQEKLIELKVDFAIFDTEILPWNVLAKDMIEEQFKIVGESIYQGRLHTHGVDSEETIRAKEFLNTLKYFDQENFPPHCRIFNVVSHGTVTKSDRNSFQLNSVGLGAFMKAEKRYEIIAKFATKHLLPVEYQFVDTTIPEQVSSAVTNWENYCKKGGEGWVIKISPLVQFLPDGGYVNPMLKARGRDYLTLVYGVDYLEKNYFEKIKKRNIGVKRLLALRENEISQSILKSFLSGDNFHRCRFVAAFHSLDVDSIDKTL